MDSVFSNLRFFLHGDVYLLAPNQSLCILQILCFRVIFLPGAPESISHIKCTWHAHPPAAPENPEASLSHRKKWVSVIAGAQPSLHKVIWNCRRIHHILKWFGCCPNPWEQGLNLKCAWLLTTCVAQTKYLIFKDVVSGKQMSVGLQN